MVVVDVRVAERNIGNDSRTATTGTILKETPKTHQRRDFSFFSLLYNPSSLYKIYKQQILLTDFTPLSIMLLFWVFG